MCPKLLFFFYSDSTSTSQSGKQLCVTAELSRSVSLKIRSFTLQIHHLTSTLFECCLNIRSLMEPRDSGVIVSVIQADCIKAISAKWNMCLVSAAHSLFICLLTYETNWRRGRKKKQSCLWPCGLEEHWLMSSRRCAAYGFILNVINLSLPGRLNSPQSEEEEEVSVWGMKREEKKVRRIGLL